MTLPQFAVDYGAPEPYRKRVIGGSMYCVRIEQCWADKFGADDMQVSQPCADSNWGDNLGLCKKHREQLCG